MRPQSVTALLLLSTAQCWQPAPRRRKCWQPAPRRRSSVATACGATRRDVGAAAVGAALAPAVARAAPATTKVLLAGERLGLELEDAGGRVRVRRVREGTEAYDKGVTPLAYVVAINGRPVPTGATAADVGKALRSAPRPVELALDIDSAYAGLDRASALERMAQAQGNPTARLQIVGVFPSDVSPCMRSRTSDVVEVDYVGSVAGVVFDSRRRFAAMLGSKELPAGLELGLFEMCIGERRLLRVPPALGFGSRGSKLYGVPPDATLDYDVTLRGINLQYDPRVRREDLDFEQRY